MIKLAGLGFCLVGAGLACPAYATDGYYLTGQNARAMGMGGVGIALPQGPEAATINPAGASFVGNSFEIGTQLLTMDDKVKNLFIPGNNVNGHQFQPIPDFGLNYHLNDRVTLALTSFGGGLGQSYDAPFFPGMGFSKEHANFLDIGIAPTVSIKLRDNLSVGASLGVVNEFFRASGVIVPTPVGPAQLPSHGWRHSFGVGGRFGALWRPTPQLTIGAIYITKINSSHFAGYDKDLFATLGGGITMPEQYGAGISFKPTPRLTLGFDCLQSNWSGVKAFSTQAGFGWRDHTNYKFGASYDVLPWLTVRAGASLAQRHFANDYVIANVNTPGVSSQSLTVGFTTRLSQNNELTFSGDYELGGKVTGSGPSAGTTLDSSYGFGGVSFTHHF